VRTGYQVVSDNVQQGRLAAQRFGSGEYNISDVPKDVTGLTQRVLFLARELTATTLDVIDRLVQETRSATAGRQTTASGPATPGTAGLPPAPGTESPVTKAMAPTPPPALQRIALIVAFSGPGKAKAADRSSVLLRSEPASIISADPLAATTGGGESISGVSFGASASGVVAIIDIPEGQAKGVYSGLISASGAVGAVGYLSIEVLE